MPWTTEDVEKHMKGLSAKAKKTWVNVANSALATCQEKGGEDCEGSAIRQANSVAKKQMEDDEKTYYYLTDISDIQLEEKEGKKSSYPQPAQEEVIPRPDRGDVLKDAIREERLLCNLGRKGHPYALIRVP